MIAMKKIILLSLLFLTCLPLPGWAGWYEVRNYTGALGSHSVHMSLQRYVWSQQGKLGEVDDSYYYFVDTVTIHGSSRLPKAIAASNGGGPLYEAE